MNNQFNTNNGDGGEVRSSKKSYGRFVAKFLGLVVVAFAVYIGWRGYRLYEAQKNLGDLVNGLNSAAQEEYQKAMADTYGGHTPQETLQMYIDAVEKGDYVLASKYFTAQGQEKELNKLNNIPKEKIDNMIELIKESLVSTGSFSDDKKSFFIEKPISIDFILYPNGLWKILEI